MPGRKPPSFAEEALKALRERLELLADRGIMGAEYQDTLRRYEEMREIARRGQDSLLLRPGLEDEFRRAYESDFNSDDVIIPGVGRVPAMEEFEERVTRRRIAEEQAKMDAYANAMQEQVKYGIGFVSARDVYGVTGSPVAPPKPATPAELPTTGINVLGRRQIEID